MREINDHKVQSQTNTYAIDTAILYKLKDLDKPGKPSVIKKIIEIYIRMMNEKLTEINEDLNNQNFKRLIQNAHMLKSSSASVGAISISNQFNEIESNSSQENLSKSKEAFKKIEDDYIKAKPILEAILKEYE